MFTSRLLTDLLKNYKFGEKFKKLKAVDPIKFIKAETTVGVSKRAKVLGRAATTSGLWKKKNRFIFLSSIIVKRDFKNFWDGAFFLTKGDYLIIVKSIIFNAIK